MSSTKLLLVGGVAAVMLTAAPSAGAAGSVYGGTTSGGEPIVLKADATGKALSSAVIGWRADCTNGGRLSNSGELTATTPTPGFSPGFDDLLMSRNAKGRFAGTQVGGGSTGSAAVAMTVDLSGTLGKTRATGILHAVIKAVDPATGATSFTCDTGNVRFSAARSPGTIFGGRTSQGEPAVVRINPKSRVITDLFATWRTSTCTPDGAFRFPDAFGNFRVKRTGAFGGSFTYDASFNDGTKRHFAYTLSGRVLKTKATGSLRATFTDTDATGAQTRTCDSGTIAFKATTG